MTLVEIITIAILTVLSANAIRVLGNLGSWLRFKRESEIMKQAEIWIDKALNSYRNEIRRCNDINDKNLLIDEVAEWMNENAKNVVKTMGFKNDGQFKDWIRSEINEVLNNLKEN